MTFHLEYRTARETRFHQTGNFASLVDAMQSAIRAEPKPVIVLESADGRIRVGHGVLRAVLLSDGSVIRDPVRPAWWDGVSERAQRALLERFAELPEYHRTPFAAAVRRIGRPGWSDLSVGDIDWIRAEGAWRHVTAE